MATPARRAVRFFGTLHARVDAVRKEGADLMTPERFPAVLATAAVSGLIVGWQVMDHVQNAAVRVVKGQLGKKNAHQCVECRLWGLTQLVFLSFFRRRNKGTWKSMPGITRTHSTTIGGRHLYSAGILLRR